MINRIIKNSFLLCWAFLVTVQVFAQSKNEILSKIQKTSPLAFLANGKLASGIAVKRNWNGNICDITVINTNKQPINLKEIQLFNINKLFAPTTSMYGEGFQLLSQTGGTLGNPKDMGDYTDGGHYKMAEPRGYKAIYNVLELSPSPQQKYLFGFTSSNRYIGKFYISADTIKVVMDMENKEIAPGATVKLEGFYMENNSDRNLLYDNLAAAVEKNHPMLKLPLATGWCSWICFGPEVTAKNVYDNLISIKKEVPQLRYIQIDDGYQASMGDWLTVGKSFNGGIKEVLKKIKSEGFEPAIWVAPFICDTNSTIYKEHKDWLLKDEKGQPLNSASVGFGGWRLAPWYVLDGTHPEVQKHFENVFRTMRQEWGCTYFKLDANYWGAIHGATYYRKNATRTEAYREGMKAIIKGAGDAYVLGCNQPMWPSLGVVHANRTSMDIAPDSWKSIIRTGRENLLRSWQNGRFWWNDPDCVILNGKLPENQYRFHATLLYATGGMLLSGDDVGSISPIRLNILKKVANATGIAAQFNADTFDYGWINKKNEQKLVVLNWNNNTKTFTIPIKKSCTLIDYYTGKRIGKFDKEIVLSNFPAQDGAIYLVQ